jgi:polysaccharide biosynthesis transport protein
MNETRTHNEIAEETSLGSLLPHLPTIIGQRKWLFLVPALAGLLLGIAAAYLLPVTYQSRAVLLVEAPALPDTVALDVSGLEIIDQRMARIRQQLLSRQALIEIIQRNNLYTTELKIKTLSEVMDDMRDAIQITPVTANLQSNSQRSTIAFSMSFDYSDPIKTQAVIQALVDQVLQINASTQSRQASNTVQFLTDQSDGLRTQIQELERQILGIKANNGATLSGLGASLAVSGATYDSQITSLEQANSALRAQRQLLTSAADRDPEVVRAEDALAALKGTFSDGHPDVILAKQRLTEAKRVASDRQKQVPAEQIRTIDAQVALNNRQLDSLKGAKSTANAMVSAQQRAPVLQEQLDQLQQRLAQLNEQYRKVSQQLSSAEAGKKAEDEQQGERLSLVDPPVIPDRPVSPNRPLLIFAGLALGLAFGLFLILAMEFIFRPIRHIDTVAAVTGEPPLVVIPTIYAPGERKDGLLARLWPGGGDDDDD